MVKNVSETKWDIFDEENFLQEKESHNPNMEICLDWLNIVKQKSAKCWWMAWQRTNDLMVEWMIDGWIRAEIGRERLQEEDLRQEEKARRWSMETCKEFKCCHTLKSRGRRCGRFFCYLLRELFHERVNNSPENKENFKMWTWHLTAMSPIADICFKKFIF